VIILDIENRELKFCKNSKDLDGKIKDVAFFPVREGSNDENSVDPALNEFRLLLSLSAGDYVEVEESPYDISYVENEVTYPWNVQIIPNEPIVKAGSAQLKYRVNRNLPDGLTLDENSGIVSGCPSGKTSMDLSGWRHFCFQMYKGKLGEQGWSKARASILKSLGAGLNDEELKIRARSMFEQFDADGSGEIEFQELQDAMSHLQVMVSTDELMVTFPALQFDTDYPFLSTFPSLLIADH
jgi:hypothetical protein